MKNTDLLTIHFESFINKNKNIFIGKNIAIAISGGADSLALAVVSNKFKHKYNYKLIAFTVDHQLRKESAKEAKQVKYLMNTLEIDHHTLVWAKEKPSTKIQESARIARYDLLCEACNKYKCDSILLGHHADDQVETFIIRLEANSGLDGLSCMQEKTKLFTSYGQLNLIRPLLNLKKQMLIKICNKNNIAWIEDPSNLNIKYSRAKIRKLLINSDLFDSFNKSINLFGKLKLSIDRIIYNNIKDSIKFNEIGICEISLENFKKLPNIFQKKLLNNLIRIIGGKKYPRKNSIINGALEKITSLDNKNTTIGGAYIIINKDSIFMSRQLDNSIKANNLISDKSLWDRRFIVCNHTNNKNITIGPLGEKDYLLMIKLNKIQKPSINFNAIKTIPTIRILEEIISIPHLLYWKSNFWKKNIEIIHVEHILLKTYKNLSIY
ncbi:tRNA lysidine(34) synthetase TilS [Alphaproteobacteria bacterium]|nr:tRNA lysidine(34) synthetase TilS [Alphaproteobacteria bacterium]